MFQDLESRLFDVRRIQVEHVPEDVFLGIDGMCDPVHLGIEENHEHVDIDPLSDASLLDALPQSCRDPVEDPGRDFIPLRRERGVPSVGGLSPLLMVQGVEIRGLLLIEGEGGPDEIRHLVETREGRPIRLLMFRIEKDEPLIDEGVDEIVLILEIQVKGGLVQLGRLGELIHAHPLDPVSRDEAFRRFQDRVPAPVLLSRSSFRDAQYYYLRLLNNQWL